MEFRYRITKELLENSDINPANFAKIHFRKRILLRRYLNLTYLQEKDII